jgi:O-antigen/teichoic acid export membrane protein
MDLLTPRRVAAVTAMLAGMAGIAVARSVPVGGVPRPYRLVAAIVALMPALVVLSTMHRRFDSERYLAARGWRGVLGDGAVVVVLSTTTGFGALTAALAVGAPFAVGAAALVAYVATVLFFRRRNNVFYMDRDEIAEGRELPDIEDYPEEVQEEILEK